MTSALGSSGVTRIPSLSTVTSLVMLVLPSSRVTKGSTRSALTSLVMWLWEALVSQGVYPDPL